MQVDGGRARQGPTARGRETIAADSRAGRTFTLLESGMAKKERHVSETPATQWLRQRGID